MTIYAGLAMDKTVQAKSGSGTIDEGALEAFKKYKEMQPDL